MGLIKFEVEIPEFDEEISITVILKRDGKVVETTTSPSTIPSPTVTTPPVKKKKSNGKSLLGDGNMMNLDI